MLEAYIRAHNENVVVPIVRTSGSEIRTTLERLFSRARFDTSLVTRFGALSLDVGNGADITAIAPYNPSRHVVSEPITQWDSRVVHGGLERRLALETVGAGTDLIVVDGDPLDGIGTICINKAPVGLATMLNIYPTRLGEGYLSMVGKHAKNVLVPGGLMVLSVREETTDYEDIVLDEFMRLQMHSLQEASGINYQYYREPQSRAGAHYILAKRSLEET